MQNGFLSPGKKWVSYIVICAHNRCYRLLSPTNCGTDRREA